MAIKFPYNPFNDAGITTYEQFKLYPYLVFGTLKDIENRVREQINQIKNNFFFSERLIFIGDKGVGKTSALFFIKDMLEAHHIKVYYFSRLFSDLQSLHRDLNSKIQSTAPSKEIGELRFNEEVKTLFNQPTYILIDFPDTMDNSNFKNFSTYIGELFNHPNYNKINFIFSMNDSHYKKAKPISELLDKFMLLNINKLDADETKELIDSRLKIFNMTSGEVFNEEVFKLIFAYSKGTPRNIISACSLLISSTQGDVTYEAAQEILKFKYISKVIDDRVTDLELNRVFKQMIMILEKDFNGTANSQEEYIKKATEILGIGRNSLMNYISELSKFGVIRLYKGGYNRLNKIITIENN